MGRGSAVLQAWRVVAESLVQGEGTFAVAAASASAVTVLGSISSSTAGEGASATKQVKLTFSNGKTATVSVPVASALLALIAVERMSSGDLSGAAAALLSCLQSRRGVQMLSGASPTPAGAEILLRPITKALTAVPSAAAVINEISAALGVQSRPERRSHISPTPLLAQASSNSSTSSANAASLLSTAVSASSAASNAADLGTSSSSSFISSLSLHGAFASTPGLNTGLRTGLSAFLAQSLFASGAEGVSVLVAALKNSLGGCGDVAGSVAAIESACQLLESMNECVKAAEGSVNNSAPLASVQSVGKAAKCIAEAAPTIVLLLSTAQLSRSSIPSLAAAEAAHAEASVAAAAAAVAAGHKFLSALTRLLQLRSAESKALLLPAVKGLASATWAVVSTAGVHIGGGFHEGEIVMAEDNGGSTGCYPAKILRINKPSELTFQYFIHYQGWHRKFDTWVQSDQICKIDDADARAKLKQQAAEKYRAAREAEKAKKKEQWLARKHRKKGDGEDVNGDEYESDEDSDFGRSGSPGAVRMEADDAEDPEDLQAEAALLEEQGAVPTSLLLELLLSGKFGGWSLARRLLYTCYLQFPESVLGVVVATGGKASAASAPAAESEAAGVSKGKRKIDEVVGGVVPPPPPLHQPPTTAAAAAGKGKGSGKATAPPAPTSALALGQAAERLSLFHLLMLAESEGAAASPTLVPSAQSNVALSQRGLDFLSDMLSDEATLSAPASASASVSASASASTVPSHEDLPAALDAPLLLALHVLASRLPIPAAFDAGTAIQSLEEYDGAAFKAARSLVLVAARRHPVLFLRLVPQMHRELQVSLKLAAYTTQSSGFKHQSFRSSTAAQGALAEPISAPSLTASNFNGRERVSVVFRSRSNTEMNEVLWDTLRSAINALPPPVLASSSGRGLGQGSVHDLVSVLSEVGRRRALLRGTLGLISASLRRVQGWDDHGLLGAKSYSGHAEADFEDDVARSVSRGEMSSGSMAERWDVLAGLKD